MAKEEYNLEYYKQASLLLKVLPNVFETTSQFVLHGGTAINFFLYEGLHRLSVDIDLKYITKETTASAAIGIKNELEKIINQIRYLPYIKKAFYDKNAPRIHVESRDNVKIKIDTSVESREVIGEIETLDASDAVKNEFEIGSMKIPIAPRCQIYGSKIAAGLSRQKPRDMFDCMIFLKNHTIDESVKEGFFRNIILSSARNFRILNPLITYREFLMEKEFNGMTYSEFTYQDHKQSLIETIRALHSSLDKEDKQFLLNFELGTPDYDRYHWMNSIVIKEKLEQDAKLEISQKNRRARISNLLDYFEKGPSFIEKTSRYRTEN